MMKEIDPGLVTLVFNGVLLVVQLYTTAKISELKVYMHENFIRKSNGHPVSGP